MAYRHNDNLYKHKVRANKFRKVTVFAVCFVLIVAGIVGADWLMSELSSSGTVVSRETRTSVQSANVSAYRTEYFQFQAPQEWVLINGESTDNRFVYVKNTGNLITQRFTVYINRADLDREADFNLTRILPVQLTDQKRLDRVGDVSTHCDESFPKDGNRDPRRIIHDEVSFVCNPDSAQYTIAVGIYKGTESIPAKLRDGRNMKMVLLYEDLTAYPNTGDIYNIVSSFQIL